MHCELKATYGMRTLRSALDMVLFSLMLLRMRWSCSSSSFFFHELKSTVQPLMSAVGGTSLNDVHSPH